MLRLVYAPVAGSAPLNLTTNKSDVVFVNEQHTGLFPDCETQIKVTKCWMLSDSGSLQHTEWNYIVGSSVSVDVDATWKSQPHLAHLVELLLALALGFRLCFSGIYPACIRVFYQTFKKKKSNSVAVSKRVKLAVFFCPVDRPETIYYCVAFGKHVYSCLSFFPTFSRKTIKWHLLCVILAITVTQPDESDANLSRLQDFKGPDSGTMYSSHFPSAS